MSLKSESPKPESPKPDSLEPDSLEPESRRKAAPLPGWLAGTLTRRAGGRSSSAGSHATSVDVGQSGTFESWPRTKGDPLDLTESEGPRGAFAQRRQVLKLDGATHGDWRLAEIAGADSRAIERLTKDPALAGVDLGRAIYLDTETTGLSGGAGVYVYMVGLGWFEGDQYVSWQGFLRHPGEEAALLEEVARLIAAAPSVVSFFGKSFDRHRLEDKMRIAGVEPPFEGRPHLDLYHPMRRLTRGAFPDGKLQTLEKALLGFHRERDLPGSLAPAAWFDYLAGRPHMLEGVFHHNYEDVLSLVVMAAYLGRAELGTRVSGEPLRGPGAHRARALAETTSDPAERLRWASEALELGADGEGRRAMQQLRADLLRRARRTDEARAAYREALEECADDRAAIDLFVGASMLLEHDLRDRENALRMVERALSLARVQRRPSGVLDALGQRAERLATPRLSES